MNTSKKPELLLPAGSYESFLTAILYGADAVYCGIPTMNLRSANSNFNIDELATAIDYAHKENKKVYLALNLFSRNEDIKRLNTILPSIKTLNPDALIIADPGIFGLIKKEFPSLHLHISTQANICSSLTVNFWKSQGANLCVLGREVSFKEALQIRKDCPDIKLEIFIHGAMCIAYSGRCLLSSFMAGRGANRGLCAHSCRWKYKSKLLLEEELRPNEYLELYEDDKGSYVLNSKDLCLMPKLNQILEANFNSLKIEGRNKSRYYIAQTARVYRKAIDDYFENPNEWKPDLYLKELSTIQNRGYTIGFFDGLADENSQDYIDTSSKSEWQNIGIIKDYKAGILEIEIKNKIKQGDTIELLSPKSFKPIKITVNELYDGLSQAKVNEVSAGKINQTAKIPISDISLFIKHAVLRKKKDN
jgi:putative protease